MSKKAITLALAASTIFALPQLSKAQDTITGDIVAKMVFRRTPDGRRNNETAYGKGIASYSTISLPSVPISKSNCR
ncbi:hypothetical protein QO004_001168 [Rhizobium mesoamericanum]|uniref:hypothetical protein n=1 Tax=Rhizobium mesoamericanum TaxID=1079800 RepID=UPI002784B7C0|nr:hypothetical protein [Rhizobium mesoamericanum]MDQ0559390.1 hypothetical protein [Rhizobium mesoamericanum]